MPGSIAQRIGLITAAVLLVLLTLTHLDVPLPQRLRAAFTVSAGSTISATTRTGRARPLETYLPYTFGYASLLQTLQAYDHAGSQDIVVFDKSWDHYAYQSRNRLMSEFASVSQAVRAPVRMSFSQIQGKIDNIT